MGDICTDRAGIGIVRQVETVAEMILILNVQKLRFVIVATHSESAKQTVDMGTLVKKILIMMRRGDKTSPLHRLVRIR